MAPFIRATNGNVVELGADLVAEFVAQGHAGPFDTEEAAHGAAAPSGESGDPQDSSSGRAHPDGEPTERWTIPQLKAYASEHGIDLGDAKLKPDVFAAVTAGAPTGEDDQEDEGDETEDEDAAGATS